jgi:hypothetical protein
VGRYSFDVKLLHLLLSAGLSRRTNPSTSGVLRGIASGARPWLAAAGRRDDGAPLSAVERASWSGSGARRGLRRRALDAQRACGPATSSKSAANRKAAEHPRHKRFASGQLPHSSTGSPRRCHPAAPSKSRLRNRADHLATGQRLGGALPQSPSPFLLMGDRFGVRGASAHPNRRCGRGDGRSVTGGRISRIGRPGVDAQPGEEIRDRLGSAVARGCADRDGATPHVVYREVSRRWPRRSVVRDEVHRSPTGTGHVFVVVLVRDVDRSARRDRAVGSNRRRVSALWVTDVEHAAAAQAGDRSGSSVATMDIVKPRHLSRRLHVARPVACIATRP